MEWSQLGILGVGAAAIIPFWQQARNFITKIFRIFIKQRIIRETELQNFFYKELYDNSFVINFDDYDLKNYYIFSLKHNKYLSGFFKLYKLEIFLYKKFIPIYISGQDEALKITYLKYTFNFDKKFQQVLNKYYDYYINETNKKEKQSRFYVEEIKGKSLKLGRLIEENKAEGTKSPSYGAASSNNSSYTIYPYGIRFHKLNNRIFGFDINDVSWDSPTYSIKNKYVFTEKGRYILEQVRRWLQAEKFYQEHNIPYRRGILLNGHTGSGKSSLVLEIAKELGIPIYIFDLSTFDNEEFCSKIGDLSSYPGIILFEDIDNQYHGREIVNKSQNYIGLTFDCFINKLSGVKSIKNKFVFITTNHLDKVDSALCRSGRIDEIIDLPFLNKEERTKMASIILDHDKEVVNKIVEENAECSTAEFENVCTKKALELYWNK